MPADLIEMAGRMIASIEQPDLAAVRAGLSERLSGWDPEPWIAGSWRPQLDDLAGPHRTVIGTRQVNDVMARVKVCW